jgi:hypothetical protein
MDIDGPTEVALATALQNHGATCAACRSGEQCEEADELREELALLFPPDRRSMPRH